MKDRKIVVCGAGGFIGGHLVADLLRQGLHQYPRRRSSSRSAEWYQIFAEVENLQLDLQEKEACDKALDGARIVYNLAADMGGMGFIENNKALCMLSVLINTHLLMAAQEARRRALLLRVLAPASTTPTSRRDPERHRAEGRGRLSRMPEDGYGWEKLFSERMCRHFREDFGLADPRARYHNVYGPHGTYDGGREKAPAAICRKVIEAKLSGNHEIEIWGDGHQTRSFMYIDDCVKGTQDIMRQRHSSSRSTSAAAKWSRSTSSSTSSRTSPASS